MEVYTGVFLKVIPFQWDKKCAVEAFGDPGNEAYFIRIVSLIVGRLNHLARFCLLPLWTSTPISACRSPLISHSSWTLILNIIHCSAHGTSHSDTTWRHSAGRRTCTCAYQLQPQQSDHLYPTT